MKIAISGCDGFVGSHLIKRLENEINEIIKIDFNYGYDITQWSSLESLPEFDVLIHLAAKSFVPQSYKTPLDFYNVNVLGTLNVLELCRKYNAKMVFTSSYVYGHPQYLPIDEKHPVEAFNPYSQSKIIGEQLCQGYHRDFKTKIVIVRPFNIYGFGQDENFLIPSIIVQAKTGTIKLQDPTPKRDFIYIKDLVEAYYNAINFDSEELEIFNLGSGIGSSISEITDQVKDAFSGRLDIQFSNKKRINEVNETVANIKKAQQLLGWYPKFTLSEGIKDYLKMGGI